MTEAVEGEVEGEEVEVRDGSSELDENLENRLEAKKSYNSRLLDDEHEAVDYKKGDSGKISEYKKIQSKQAYQKNSSPRSNLEQRVSRIIDEAEKFGADKGEYLSSQLAKSPIFYVGGDD